MNVTLFDISIIIPIYNVQDYIVETLDSVVHQNAKCNIECILVDDCGKDSSVSLVEEFIENYNGLVRFRIIHHPNNRGLSAARNTGIVNAKGQYLFFLDGDDKLYPDSLLSLWNVVQNHPNVDIVKGDFEIEGFSNSILRKDFPPYTDDICWIRTNLCNLSIPESACNCLVRRKLIIDNKLFFMEGWIQEDTLWTFKIQRHVMSIAFCHKQTYFYRTNPNSIMHTMDKEKEANAYSRIYNEAYHDMLSTKLELCELRYLEIMADRVYHAIGKIGLRQLCTCHNPFFNLLFQCNRIIENKRNVFVVILLGKYRSILRKLLCKTRVFCYSSVNNTL